MRLVDLKEFMTLPAGTIYEQVDGDDDSLKGRICLKGNNSEHSDNDWDELELSGTQLLDTKSFSEESFGFQTYVGNAIAGRPLETIPEARGSIPYDQGWGRHGLYPDLDDNEYRFFVYEKADVVKVIAILLGALVRSLSPGETVSSTSAGLEIPFTEKGEPTARLVKYLSDWVNGSVRPPPAPDAPPKTTGPLPSII